jgi:citrate synthase
MDILKQKFKEKFPAVKAEIKALVKEKGDVKVGDITLGQIYGGARSIKMMIWETSSLDPNEGIRFRGYSIPELQKLLPKAPGGTQPLPEGIFWLMLVDEIPTEEEVRWLSKEWVWRGEVPHYVHQMLDTLPLNTHPMTQFSMAISAMQNSSHFLNLYEKGMDKEDYWDPIYEDTMDLIARLPRIAAYIYRRTYFNNVQIPPDFNLDWAGNFATMLGIGSDSFKDLLRLYMTIHADHEGGNASAHTVHLVGSTLSDPYLSFSAGINALAGPLHGLANQEVIRWINHMVETLGTTRPTSEQVADYVKETISHGRVVPGYGHAVLRKPDPRFLAQKEFAEQNMPDDDIVNVVWKVFEVVPPILQDLGKVSNPWPNVDAHSGAILCYYGLDQHNFYTVLFGVSRALGVLAATCWARALGFPLERPKSITTQWVREFLAKQNAAS